MAMARFTTEVLDQALEHQWWARERLRQEVRDRLLQLLAAAPVELPEAIIFGSILRAGAFGHQSDVDLAIPPVSPRTYVALKSYLERGLNREIDLVDLDGCHFADSIVRDGRRWKRPVT